MIKKSIKFEGFDGEEVTEDHYFHLSKSEVVRIDLENQKSGGFVGKLRIIGESKDSKLIFEAFKELVLQCYGIRDPDNPSRFRKSPEISAEFEESLAFDALILELMTDLRQSVEFVSGVFPKSLGTGLDVQKALEDAGFSPEAIQDVLNPGESVDVVTFKGGTSSDSAIILTPQITNLKQRDADLEEEQNRLSGLKNPRRRDGTLLPWAFRDPTDDEVFALNKAQLVDLHHRNRKGWTPPPVVPLES